MSQNVRINVSRLTKEDEQGLWYMTATFKVGRWVGCLPMLFPPVTLGFIEAVENTRLCKHWRKKYNLRFMFSYTYPKNLKEFWGVIKMYARMRGVCGNFIE